MHICLAPLDIDHQHNDHTTSDNYDRRRDLALGVNIDKWSHVNLLFVKYRRLNNHNPPYHNGYHLCVERGVDRHCRNRDLPHEQHYPATVYTD